MELFEINNDLGFEMKNRIIRSATYEAMAGEDGFPTDDITKLYVRLAEGDVGMMITGYATPQTIGKPSDTGMLMINRDELIPYYQKLTEAVHAKGSRIVIQIGHCGPNSFQKDRVAPSAVRNMAGAVPRELSNDEIEIVINDFVAAVERAQKAGFDGAQIHGAHGYLLCSFLSPQTNKRTDQWGGSLENRFRVLREIFVRAKAKLPDFPLLIKLSAYDNQKNGLSIEETVQISTWLEEIGCNGIEVSCGVPKDGFSTMRSPQKPVDAMYRFVPQLHRITFPPVRWLIKKVIGTTMKLQSPIHNYNVAAARAIKAVVKIPVIVVGGIREKSVMQDILNNGDGDYVSLCRPFILEPSLVKHLQKGKQEIARCNDCGYCMFGIFCNSLRCYYGKVPK